MKTMMELVIRLNELERLCRRAAENPQLTEGEKASAHFYTNLVREVIPAAVLAQYTSLETSEPALLECPEIFAMAVLVSAYRKLAPDERKKLVAHFRTGVLPDGELSGAEGNLPENGEHFIRCRGSAQGVQNIRVLGQIGQRR